MNNNKLILSYLSNTKIIDGIIPFAQSIRLINNKNFDVVIIDTSDKPIPSSIKEILSLCDIKLIQTPKILPNLYIDRFLLYSNFLKEYNYDFIILTDLTDVYFQRNPFVDIDDISGDKAIISSENILIKNSPWNFDIIKHLYGYNIARQIENNNVINSGIIAGNKNVLIKLCNLIVSEYLQNQSSVVGIDQGILMKIMHSRQNNSNIEYEYAPHIFSIMLAVYFYYPKKLVYNYKTTINNINITSDNIPYSIVHQYNRNTTLKSLVIDHYKSML